MKSGDTMQIKWTVSALNDLASEMDYLAKEASEDIARKVYHAIQDKISNLQKFPLGREGRIFGTKELIMTDFQYIIPYRVCKNRIEILAIFHTKRKLPEAW
jgi:plasmid stabilization system protein ParE